jgi:hypothetical protein
MRYVLSPTIARPSGMLNFFAHSDRILTSKAVEFQLHKEFRERLEPH